MKQKIFEGPKLYKKNVEGKIEQWQIRSTTSGVVIVEYGEHGGKLITTKYSVNAGKNIGKINETSIMQQAANEAKSKWTKKVKAGYVPSFIDAQRGLINTELIEGGINPQLLKNFKKEKKKVSYPCFAQPKLNGQRCIAVKEEGRVTLWTRTRKPITSCPHVIDDLEFILANHGDVILDGELYNHDLVLDCGEDNTPFEKLMSAVRKQKPSSESLLAEYHVYDLASEVLTTKERQEVLNELKSSFEWTSVHYVETHEIEDEKTLMIYHKSNIKRRYEGTVVRNMNAVYRFERTSDCLKLKDFDDDEFKILGFKIGKQDTVVAKCTTKNGEIFEPTMKGSKKENLKYLNDKSYIGKMLTVQYQGLTGKNKVPLFPVGLRIREE